MYSFVKTLFTSGFYGILDCLLFKAILFSINFVIGRILTNQKDLLRGKFEYVIIILVKRKYLKAIFTVL